MKYLKLFVTLLIVTVLVTSFSVAGKSANVGKGTSLQSVEKSLLPNVATKSLGKKGITAPLTTGSDINPNTAMMKAKTSKPRAINSNNRDLTSPTPRKEVMDILPLSGTYHIPGDFSSIANAVAVLNYVGVGGNVLFQLDNATYTEFGPIVVGAYTGNDTYTVTLSPAAATAVTIDFVSTTANGKGIVFNGASNFIIDGINAEGASLTMKWADGYPFPSGDAFLATVYITGACEHITVTNANVQGITNNAVWADVTDAGPAIFVWADDDDASESAYLTFDHLTITHATYAIKILSEGVNFGGAIIDITNNLIGGAYGDPVAIGVLAELTYYVNFSHNIVDGVRYLQTFWYAGYTEWDIDQVFAGANPFMYGFGQVTAAHFLLADNIEFSYNILRNIGPLNTVTDDGVLTYGTRVYAYNFGLGGTSYMYNNVMYGFNVQGATASASSGQINGVRGPAGNVWHNSIQLTGASDLFTTTNCINGTTTAYSNALSNEMTGGDPTKTRGYATGGTFDYNAVYSTGYYVSGYSTMNAAIAAGQNPNGVFGDPNFDADLHITAGPSSAENAGKSNLFILDDIAGNLRDTAAAATRDAGAYEFGALTPSFGPDLICSGIITPPAGVPTAVPQVITVRVKNNGGVAVGAFTVTVTTSDGYNQTENVASIPALSSLDVPFAVTWTPAVAGPYTFNASVSVAGDIDATNDAPAPKTVTAENPTPLTDRTFTWNSDDEGWTRSVDWVRSNSFTKLGGPKDGYSMVTNRPNLVSTYTEGAIANTQGYATTYPGANILLSPWYDLSGMAGTDLYISLYQTLITEPEWDRSWMEYTVDGLNWQHVGTLNDPNGINWYNEALYTQAQIDPEQFDYGTAQTYGLMTGEPADWASWTSNGDGSVGTPEGPEGWVFNQVKLTSPEYPTRASAIRFRFIAFSDAYTAMDPGGWAIDDLFIGANAPPLYGTLAGKVYTDINGNGTYDLGSDTPMNGVDVEIYRFGNLLTTLTTNVDGDYTYAGADIPAAYTVKVIQTGYAYTEPADAATSGETIINHPAQGSTETANFGAYVGSVSGVVFKDVNDNGVNDTEAGYAGWVVEVYNGTTLLGSVTTPANGAYSFNLPPGTFDIKLVAQPTIGRQTLPLAGANIEVTIAGNSGTNALTGQDFGVFQYGALTLWAVMDVNGNGIRETENQSTTGAIETFIVSKNGTPLDTIVLGAGTASETYSSLDLGTYTFALQSVPAGWVLTNIQMSQDITISTGGVVQNASFLFFKKVKFYGYKFEDLNGNGVKDTGEPGLEGWTINISGTGGASLVTDADGYYEQYVEGGAHVISEVLQSGWVQTKPSGAGTYSTTTYSGVDPGIFPANFGNFQVYDLSGLVYMDLNGNGAKDASEPMMDNVTVTLTGSTDALTSGGAFAFANVGAGAKTLAVTVPSGFSCTEPVGGTYAVTGTSALDQPGFMFGLASVNMDATYRTFTLAELNDVALSKVVKKSTKTPLFPNLVNWMTDIFNEAKAAKISAGVIVGLEGQLLDDGKTLKGYVKPVKATDIQTSLVKKAKTGNIYQTGTAKGLDFLYPGKSRILKLQKSISPAKHNNVLFADLLALGLNLVSSDWGYTPAGLGDLVYNGEGTYSGMSITEIYTASGDLMTNWEGHTPAELAELQTVVEAINAEFSGALDTTAWFNGGKLVWTGVKALSASTILRPGTVASPRLYTHMEYDNEPTTFSIAQNYPNPFNPTTSIPFTVPTDANVTVKVYNVLGQEVATLLNNESYFAGTYEVSFDGSMLPSGMYFYRVTAQLTNDEGATSVMTQTKKMMFTK